MSSDFDPLDRLLRRYGDPPAVPEGLEGRVRRRLAEGRARPPGWFARVDAVFARPSFAAAFVAACVLLGLFTAEIRVSRAQMRQTAQLERSYLELVDPLLKAGVIAQPAEAGAR